MLWQVADGFRYRMAGGRIGQVPPTEFMNPPSIEKISRDVPLRPDQAGLVLAYAKQNGVTSVVVDKRQAAVWAPILARIAKESDVEECCSTASPVPPAPARRSAGSSPQRLYDAPRDDLSRNRRRRLPRLPSLRLPARKGSPGDLRRQPRDRLAREHRASA